MDLIASGSKLLYVEQHYYDQLKDSAPYYVLHIQLPNGKITYRMYDPAVMEKIEAYDVMVSSSFN